MLERGRSSNLRGKEVHNSKLSSRKPGVQAQYTFPSTKLLRSHVKRSKIFVLQIPQHEKKCGVFFTQHHSVLQESSYLARRWS